MPFCELARRAVAEKQLYGRPSFLPLYSITVPGGSGCGVRSSIQYRAILATDDVDIRSVREKAFRNIDVSPLRRGLQRRPILSSNIVDV
jgi:hypothetical protein